VKALGDRVVHLNGQGHQRSAVPFHEAAQGEDRRVVLVPTRDGYVLRPARFSAGTDAVTSSSTVSLYVHGTRRR
jgi:hypothetical protein